MSTKNTIKTEGGSGGKRGHSNMTHWHPTAWVKSKARKARRAADRREAREAR